MVFDSESRRIWVSVLPVRDKMHCELTPLKDSSFAALGIDLELLKLFQDRIDKIGYGQDFPMVGVRANRVHDVTSIKRICEIPEPIFFSSIVASR